MIKIYIIQLLLLFYILLQVFFEILILFFQIVNTFSIRGYEIKIYQIV